MLKVNKNYENLKESYLFAEIEKRVKAFSSQNPDKKIIKMGIGDVTLPLFETVVNAIHEGADEMGSAASFRGYGPYEGYSFIKEPIVKYYTSRGIDVRPEELFLGDGAKNDIGNILDIFSKDNTVMVPDPVYPVYVDTNIMDGRKIVYINGNYENGFLPLPDDSMTADLIYLCSPNNPTGAVYTKEQLKAWVDFANKNDSLILFDAAYEAFISDPELPRSIYEIEGARNCAIEFCSLSKTAGFTGMRCGYTIIPTDLIRDGVSLNKMWLRRQSTKHNGVSYVVQKAAASVFSDEGLKAVKETINYYRENAKIMTDALDSLSIEYIGGKNSPYIWLRCPNGMKSWDFFDLLLNKANVVGTPGAGFGENGEGFLRLTAFNNHENTKEAMERLKNIL